MQVLLLLTLLTLGGGRKVVVGGATVHLLQRKLVFILALQCMEREECRTYQVVEGQVSQISQVGLLDAEIRKGLSCGINLLVKELALHFISGHGVPPDVLVKVVGQGLEHSLGKVHMAALLDNFTVDQLGNLRSRVVLRTVQLESLAGGVVIMQHGFKALTDINGLEESQYISFSFL